MTKCVHLPELNLRYDEIRLLLAIKPLEDGLVSLGKTAEVAGFSEKVFAEILLQRGMSPVRYTDLDLGKELEKAIVGHTQVSAAACSLLVLDSFVEHIAMS